MGLPEPKRVNGYYQYKNLHFPSVSKITGFVGGSEGLIRWACELGGYGVLWALRELQERDRLEEICSSPTVIPWIKEKALQYLAKEQARVQDFGKRVHYGIESRLKRLDLDLSEWSDNEKTALSTWEAFYAEIKFDPFLVESTIYSPLHRFAGRLDLCAPLSTDEILLTLKPYLMKNSEPLTKGLKVIDFKTGHFYKEQHALQLSAYAQGIKETYDREVTGALLICIERENPEEVSVYHYSKASLDEAFNVGFLPAKSTWEYAGAPKWYKKELSLQLEAA